MTIPNSVTSIGDSSFSGCTNLTRVMIPNSVTSIGFGAFGYCSHLTGIAVDSANSCYSSANGVLFDKSQATIIGYPGGKAGSYSIPRTVTSIADTAFSGCSRLTSVTIPNSVTSIGDSAFSGRSRLTAVTIPDNVTTIGGSAFSGCTDLTSVTIPNSVTSIGDSSFSGCTNLTSVMIPDSVTSIGDSAFSDCASLSNISIPNGVTTIGDSAFFRCTRLTAVTIPGSVINLGFVPFGYCSHLTAIAVGEGSLFYSSDDGVLFDNSQATLIEYPGGKAGPYTIPSTVTSIGASAFEGCTLASVTIPNSVTYVELEAFSYCPDLANIEVDSGNSFYSSDNGVLFDQSQATLIAYPGGKAGPYMVPIVTRLGDYAFSGCSRLTRVTIPNSVTSLGDYAFSACSSLTNVTFEGDAPSMVGTGIFLWDPSVTVYDYAGTGGWVPSPFVPPPPSSGPPCCGFPGIVSDTPAPVTIEITIPVITTQPTNVLVNPFGGITLTVTSTGTDLFYQWSRNESNILNATNSSLILSNITQSDLGRTKWL